MKMRTGHILAALLLPVLLSCSGGKGRKAVRVPEQDRAFPNVSVPSVYNSQEEVVQYLGQHYWDAFFAGGGPTDSARVLGVRTGDVEQALANYLAILDYLPLAEAQKGMAGLFDAISARQLADTSSRVYLAMTDMVSKYLYDPNSPLRDEDYYAPFVNAMARSPLTRDDMRRAYSYEYSQCIMNPRGSVAPDFVITLKDGGKVRMHSIKAEFTLLFFSNPGCKNCLEIIERLKADEFVGQMLDEKRLAVVNVYIDEDLAAWREYMPVYPKEWLNGYDAARIIREDVLYSVRAIPSLYLLDAEKRVLLKDAPVEKVLETLRSSL